MIAQTCEYRQSLCPFALKKSCQYLGGGDCVHPLSFLLSRHPGLPQLFLGTETGAAPMAHEDGRGRDVPAAKRAGLLAPVDLFAIAAPEGRVEPADPVKKVAVHRHAESDASGQLDRACARGQSVGHAINPRDHLV